MTNISHIMCWGNRYADIVQSIKKSCLIDSNAVLFQVASDINFKDIFFPFFLPKVL